MIVTKDLITTLADILVAANKHFDETGDTEFHQSPFSIYKSVNSICDGLTLHYKNKHVVLLEGSIFKSTGPSKVFEISAVERLLTNSLTRLATKQALADVVGNISLATPGSVVDIFGLQISSWDSKNAPVNRALVTKAGKIVGSYVYSTEDGLKSTIDDIEELAIRSVSEEIMAGKLPLVF